MLAMVFILGALFAGILAIPALRDFFDMTLLSTGEWFLVMLSAGIGLTIASILWRLPQIERLELPEERGETAASGRPDRRAERDAAASG
jgi:hypothetical protein